MYFTLEFIEGTYHKFNLQIFGGRLPEVPFRLSTARTFVGKCSPRNGSVHRQGRHTNDDFYLCFSTAHNLTLPQAEDTVIHEMIHLFINLHNLADSSHHGSLFRAIMGSINAAHKRNITISYNPTANGNSSNNNNSSHSNQGGKGGKGGKAGTSGGKDSASSPKGSTPNTTRRCMIAVMHDAKGWGFKLLPRTYAGITRYYNGIKHAITDFELYYAVVDAEFAAYPVSSALKIYRLDRARIFSHLITAIPYEITANAIRPKS